jgi:hypothetical protein
MSLLEFIEKKVVFLALFEEKALQIVLFALHYMPRYVSYVVKEGDLLEGIALKFGMS